jgi:hypothetical protein
MPARLSRTRYGIVPSLYWATFDQDRIGNLVEMAGRFGLEIDEDIRAWTKQPGGPGERISSTVTWPGGLSNKGRAMAAHASPFPASSWFLTLPPPAFQLLFGTEWYIEPGTIQGRTWLFED